MQEILKYACFAGLIVTLPPLIGYAVWKIYQYLVAKDLKRFKALPILAQVFLIAWFLQLFVFASTKAVNPLTGGGSTNDVEVVEGGTTNSTEWVEGGDTNGVEIVVGGETNTTEVVEGETPTNPPPMMAMGPRRRAASVPQQGFTADEIAAGIVMAREGSNEVWSAEPPEGATIIGDWVKHGAFDDWAALGLSVSQYSEITENRETVETVVTCVVARVEWAVYSQGRVLKSVSTSNGVEATEWRLLEGLGLTNEVVSVLPECRWGTNGPSRVWYKATDVGSVLVGWQNALLGRDTNGVVGIVGEFYTDGNWRVKYDWGQAGWTNVTSRFFRKLKPEDWQEWDSDGDGLSNYDEIKRYGTSPNLFDTDGDGIGDAEEIAQGSNPLDPDQDRDGIADGCDDDIWNAMSADDDDGDGIPDQFEEYWVRSTGWWDSATERDDNGFTPEGMMAAGIRPSRLTPNGSTDPDGRVTSMMLWDRFAADWPTSRTDVVYEKTIYVDRQSNWQHFYLSSDPLEAKPWQLVGMTLEWEDSDGESGTATASPAGDSLYLPLSTNNPWWVRIRLRAAGKRVRSTDPVYLLEFAPEVSFTGGQDLELSDGSTATVFTDGARSVIGVGIDWTGRPCNALLCDRERILEGLGDLPPGSPYTWSGDETGGTLFINGTGDLDLPAICCGELVPERSRPLMMGSGDEPHGPHHVIVVDPSIWYGDGHGSSGWDWWWDGWGYSVTSDYPLDGECLVREWHHSPSGWWCDCEPGISSGSSSPWVDARITGYDDYTAWGEVTVDGQVVWSDSATHDGDWHDGYDWSIEYVAHCCGDCSSGDCDYYDGFGLDSLKFRIALGFPRKNQVSGFVYFEASEGVTINRSLFQMMKRDDASVTDSTSGGVRTIRCTDERGRTVRIETITGGVRLTVTTTADGQVANVWELTNPGGNANRVHLRKLSRLDNVMEEADYARVWDSLKGEWTWQVSDGKTGITETLEREDNTYSGGTLREIRRKLDADSNQIGLVERVRTRIGEREKAKFCETYYREETGNNTIIRNATYWDDPYSTARHGKLKLLTATDRPWAYHDYDRDGREVLRVEQRNGSAVPQAFPSAGAGGAGQTAGIADAFLTTFDYSPVGGDDWNGNDNGKVRCESRYVVRNGTATLIARTWHRYTHDWGWEYNWPTVKHEVWRAGSAGASMTSQGNAYSYTVEIDEGDEYSSWYWVPFAMHGAMVEQLDEDGRLTSHEWSDWGSSVCETVRTSLGGVEAQTYEMRELDATHGKELWRGTYLTANDVLIGSEWSTYDDQNRLRSKTYLDGTTETHQYSCCRKLWSIDREGRKTLRSAVTGEDHLYWADEEVWLRAFGTGGVHRVVQHFCDGFGRETNTAVCVGLSEGEATDWTVPNARRLCADSAAYAGDAEDWFETVDRNNKRTTTRVWKSAANDEREVVEWGGGSTQFTTRTTEVRNGATTVRKSWGGKWIETETATDYDANGCKVVTETERASDHQPVARSVETCDFLGRTVSRTTPMGTTATVYDGTSRRVVSESRVVDGATRTVAPLYDTTGVQVGSVENGVEKRSDTEYGEWSNEWWRVERHLVAGSVTNSVEETWTQLTGLGYGLRSRVRRVDRSGVETVTSLEEGDENGVTVETEVSNVKSPVVRVKRYGLTVEERTGEEVVAYEYDGLGRIVGKTRSVQQQAGGDASQPETVKEERFGYDNCDQLVSASVLTNGAEWVTESYAYDAFGRVVGETDAEGNLVTTAYDAAGAVTQIGGAANPVRYGYDSSGRRTSLKTTRNGVNWDETEWEYNAGTGLCVAKEYANGSRQTMTYAGDGQLLRKTLPSGKWTQNAYDGQGRIVGIASSDGRASVSFENDEFGEVTEETGFGYAYGYTRADNGAVTNETMAVGDEEVAVRREIDEFGRLARREVCTSRAGRTQAIEWDSENRIGAISGDVARVEYRYSALGSDLGYTLRLAGGATVSREVTVDERTGRIHAVSNRVNGTLVDVWEYDRDGDGRILRRNGDSFAYDEKGQIVGACVGEEPASFGYDAAGNFSVCTHGTNGVVRSFTVNSLNQYTAAGGATLATTPDGGVSRWGGWMFAYDSAERLVAASGATGANVANFYDSRGRRIRKSADDGEHLFFWDGWNPILEVVEGECATNVVEYGWGKDVEGSLELAGGVGALIWIRVDGRVYVPLYDGNGNVTAYVGESGAVVARFEYGAFGEERNLAMNGEEQNADIGRLRFRYSTKYTEPENGLVYYGGRFYCPALGRWMSRDPIGEDAGANLYVFCRNAPTWRYDVLGALTWEEAYKNYFTGEKSVMEMDISEIDTSGVTIRNTQTLGGYISDCTKGGPYPIHYNDESVPHNSSWGNAMMLGQIHLRFDGELNIKSNGDWQFSGTMKCDEESFAFKPGGNTLRSVLTSLAGMILGEGHPFNIVVKGTKAHSESGNCCRGGWWFWR